MPTLYLIPTPSGDPDDITLRALRLLGSVSAVATPDPTATAVLCAHHGITPSRFITPPETLTALDSGDVALIGVGDVPAIADDPTAVIVSAAIRRGIRVEPIPGASLPITALVLSALPPDAFVYVGRLPDVKMCEPLTAYTAERATLVMTVSAERVSATLAALRKKFGDRPACVVNRPGAPDAVILRGTLNTIDARAQPFSGEVAIVLGGAPEQPNRVWDESEVIAALRQRLDSGEPLKVAAKALAAVSGWDRRAIYTLGIEDRS